MTDQSESREVAGGISGIYLYKSHEKIDTH